MLRRACELRDLISLPVQIAVKLDGEKARDLWGYLDGSTRVEEQTPRATGEDIIDSAGHFFARGENDLSRIHGQGGVKLSAKLGILVH